MRRVLLAVSFWLLALGFVNAQEAFYIYRNDGDFNGFFYDEVVEMRQSKIGVDTIEYDKWVTQEVVLADTIYRIPLAAIDSIGFQQPEIKINPNMRWIERDGYSPYLVSAFPFDRPSCSFRDLPADMIPKVGDVLIALPTDSKAEEMYYYNNGYEREGGSWSCVVEEVRVYPEDNFVSIQGHWVDQISDVFEQYITVEQIGVDKQGNMIRRVAGCTPEGFPRNAPAASGNGDLNLIDFTSTFTRTWNPSANSSVDLAADVTFKVKFRVAYNITWRRFMTTMSQEFTTKIKPSLSLSYSVPGSTYEFDSGELMPFDEIMFPAACPIFSIHPIPTIFCRIDGKATAKLNLPAVQLGLGLRFIIDTDALFPITCGLHIPEEDEGQEISEDMLDLSGDLTLNGFVQTGVKFSGDIATASWMKKILKSSIGTYLYVGPKIHGVLKMAQASLDEGGSSLYWNMASSYMGIALPSLDLEAKATVSVFSKNEQEKKFFDKNWSFFADTLYLAPTFENPIVDVQEENILVQIPSKQHACLGYQCVALAVRKSVFEDAIIYQTSDQTYWRNLKMYEYTIPTDEFKSGGYEFFPLLKTWSLEPFEVNACTDVTIPSKIKLDNDSLIFGATTNLQQVVEVTSNVKDSSRLWAILETEGWIKTKIETIDEQEGKYRVTFTATPNSRLFDRSISKESKLLHIATSAPNKTVYLGAYQQANDLQNFKFYVSIRFPNCSQGSFGYMNYCPVTATRVGNNKIHVEGQYTEESSSVTQRSFYVNMDLIRLGETQEYTLSGTVSEIREHTSAGYYDSSGHWVNTKETETFTATVVPTQNKYGQVTQAVYDFKKINTDTGEVLDSDHCEDTNFQVDSSWAYVTLPQ